MVIRRIWVCVVAMVALLGVAPSMAGAQGGRPVLVIVCDQQSANCKTWQSQWQPMFAGSPAYKMIDIRTISPPTAQAMMKPASWPADLRWLLDTFLMSQEGIQDEYDTPRFFLLQNGQITASSAGNNSWRDYMWPTILDVTNTRP